MAPHIEVKRRELDDFGQRGNDRRGQIAVTRDKDQVADQVEGHRPDKRQREAALLADGDQRIVGHAVDPAKGHVPDRDREGDRALRQKGLPAQHPDQDGRGEGHPNRQGQGQHEQQLDRQHVGPGQGRIRCAIVPALAGHPREGGKQGLGKQRRDDVEGVDVFVAGGVVSNRAFIAGEPLEQRHIQTPEDRAEQVIQRERKRFTHDLHPRHLALGRPRQREGQAQDAPGQNRHDHQRGEIGCDGCDRQPDDPPARKQQHRSDRGFDQRADDGQRRRDFGLVISEKQGAQPGRQAAGKLAQSQQSERDLGLRADSITGRVYGDDEDDERGRRRAQGQTQQAGVDEISEGMCPVARRVADQIRVQPEVHQDLEPAHDHNRERVVACPGRAEGPQHDQGKGHINDPRPQVQPGQDQAVAGHQPHPMGFLALAARAPDPHAADHQQRHQGHEGREGAISNRIREVAETHRLGRRGRIEMDRSEVAIDPLDRHFAQRVIAGALGPDERPPAREIAVSQNEPAFRTRGRIDPDLGVSIRGNGRRARFCGRRLSGGQGGTGLEDRITAWIHRPRCFGKAFD